jgi:hypothetical protein
MQGDCEEDEKLMACCSSPKHNGVADLLAGRDAEAVNQVAFRTLFLLFIYFTGLENRGKAIYSHRISEQ